jgi:hypothetical protein
MFPIVPGKLVHRLHGVKEGCRSWPKFEDPKREVFCSRTFNLTTGCFGDFAKENYENANDARVPCTSAPPRSYEKGRIGSATHDASIGGTQCVRPVQHL